MGEPWANRVMAREFIQHVTALNQHLAPHIRGEDTVLSESLLTLRLWAIWCLEELGESAAWAIQLGEALVADYEREAGDLNPGTLRARHHLAYAYRLAGRFDEGISLLEATLADRERVLGDTHPHTQASRLRFAKILPRSVCGPGTWETARPA